MDKVSSTIPSFELKRNYQRVKNETLEAILRVLDSQQFIMGPDVAGLEQDICRYLEVPHAAACASGTDSLLLALMALDLRPGDEVITTAFSFFATAGSIIRAGGRPVFVDVDPDTYNISMDQVKAAVTDKTRALIPVHLFGQLCRMEEIVDFLKEHGIALVEDCAQAFGAHREHEGKIIRGGAWGGLGCFSFFPTKNLGAFGDAGMTTSFSEELHEQIASLRVHGSTKTYLHDKVGINSRLDSLQAAILRVRLRHIEEWTEERREVARIYGILFAEKGLDEYISVPVEDEHNRHTYHQYVIKAHDRDALQAHLAEHGVVSRVYYPLPLHLQPCFEHLGYKKGQLPTSEKLADEVLALPMFPELTKEEQQRVVDAIASFYKK